MYWRTYCGCRCYDKRTGMMKKSVAERLGHPEWAEIEHTGVLCDCPAAIFVGRRRAKIMARMFAKST